MTRTFSLSVDSNVEQLAAVSEFVEAATRACEMDDDQTYDVQMAVDEAVSNVIEHAYRGRSDGTINITCEQRGSEFVVTIQDFGERFDPKKIVKPKTSAPLSKRSIGGLGLFFMSKLMDKVEFKFSERTGNVLKMIKKIKHTKRKVQDGE
jgi:serine/threonine-protein kinase RsbW